MITKEKVAKGDWMLKFFANILNSLCYRKQALLNLLTLNYLIIFKSYEQGYFIAVFICPNF